MNYNVNLSKVFSYVSNKVHRKTDTLFVANVTPLGGFLPN